MNRLLCVNAVLMFIASVVLAQTQASSAKRKTALYAAVGPELTTYSVDVEGASLVKQGYGDASPERAGGVASSFAPVPLRHLEQQRRWRQPAGTA